MKKIIFSGLVSLFSLSVLFAEWIEIAGNKTSEMFEHRMTAIELTEVNFSLPGYDLEIVNENGVEYHKISYWNEGRIVEIGKPDLPVISRLVAIPEPVGDRRTDRTRLWDRRRTTLALGDIERCKRADETMVLCC